MSLVMFYRCFTCQGVVSQWDVKAGGCPKCGGTKLRPDNLTLWEKLVQIWKHPKIWEWEDFFHTEDQLKAFHDGTH